MSDDNIIDDSEQLKKRDKLHKEQQEYLEKLRNELKKNNMG